MSEQLTRTYHGHKIVSVTNESPIEGSDGWFHQIGEATFHTLGAAIAYAKIQSPPTCDDDDEITAPFELGEPFPLPPTTATSDTE